MSERWLTDLASVLRGAGLNVQEEPGWQTRSRSSGGYDAGRPNALMVHHTASGPSSDGQADVNYCCYGSDSEPLANIYLSRTGKVWVMAAGATNTNGSGGPLGPVAVDSMNTSAIGIEAANDGVGEPWADVQQRAYGTMLNALSRHYAIPAGQVYLHAEWAPSRKVDAAGPSRWAPSGGTWNGNALRDDVAAGWPGTALPPPSGSTPALLTEDRMHYYIKPKNEEASSVVWVSDLTYKWAVHSGAQLDNDRFIQEVRLQQLGASEKVAKGFSGVLVLDENAWRAYGYNIDPQMTGRDVWGWK